MAYDQEVDQDRGGEPSAVKLRDLKEGPDHVLAPRARAGLKVHRHHEQADAQPHRESSRGKLPVAWRGEPVQIHDGAEVPVRPLHHLHVAEEEADRQKRQPGYRPGEPPDQPDVAPLDPRGRQRQADADRQRPDQPDPLPRAQVDDHPAVHVHQVAVEELAHPADEEEGESNPVLPKRLPTHLGPGGPDGDRQGDGADGQRRLNVGALHPALQLPVMQPVQESGRHDDQARQIGQRPMRRPRASLGRPLH